MPSPSASAARQPDHIDQVLDEFYALPRNSEDAVLDAVATAIFVEDAFGVTLSDAEIDPAHLADRTAVRATLRQHLPG
ncbi:MAG: hypothetical protein WBL05_09445 [Brooklawnia sp.]|uniref:hypothetical protein n=1 Tax=Brooklawnia sp. TaxID=2699740 RepID=UPI003C7600A1